MNLEIYKQEILRRSQERIRRRKKIRNRVLALCIPLILLAVVLIEPPFVMRKDLAAEQETVAELKDYDIGSIFCSFTKAELYVDNETVTVTDKLTVDKLYVIAAFTAKDDGFSYGGAAPNSAAGTDAATEAESATEAITDKYTMVAEESKAHLILFFTDEGNAQLYALTDEQYEEILEVLE